jgi:hypothetical protein
VGKQYMYGKGPAGLSEKDVLKQENKQLKAQLEILKKYQEIERSWSHKSLYK